MSKSDLLRGDEVRDAYRIIGECRDLGSDPALWFPRLIAGVSRLIGAFGTAGEGLEPRADRPLTQLSAFEAGLEGAMRDNFEAYMRDNAVLRDPMFTAFDFSRLGRVVTTTRRQLVPDAAYYRCEVFDRYLRGQVDHRLTSVYHLSSHLPFNIVHVARAPGERDFSSREQRLLGFLHEELGPLVGRALVSVGEPNPERLSPRLRQTLASLLEGDSEKEAAVRLRLSPATAHQYVTTLYRHFGVRSRAQLLALALKRAGQGGLARARGSRPGRRGTPMMRGQPNRCAAAV